MTENENHYTARPQMQLFAQLSGGHIEEIGAVLRYRPSDAEW